MEEKVKEEFPNVVDIVVHLEPASGGHGGP